MQVFASDRGWHEVGRDKWDVCFNPTPFRSKWFISISIPAARFSQDPFQFPWLFAIHPAANAILLVNTMRCSCCLKVSSTWLIVHWIMASLTLGGNRRLITVTCRTKQCHERSSPWPSTYPMRYLMKATISQRTPGMIWCQHFILVTGVTVNARCLVSGIVLHATQLVLTLYYSPCVASPARKPTGEA